MATKTTTTTDSTINHRGPQGAKMATKATKQAPAAPAPVEAPLSQRVMKNYFDMGLTFAMNDCTREIFVSGQPLDDAMAAEIRMRMRDNGFTNMEAIQDVYIALAGRNRFHPVKRYLDSLTWDGKDHIAKLASYFEDKHDLIVYAGGETRTVIHAWLYRWFVGAAAKPYRNGAQNAMMVLAGGQNLGKSSFVRWVGSPLPDMYIESPIDPDSKDHVRRLAGSFVWEVAELGATTRKSDVEALKNFLTRESATFRVPYARFEVTAPALANFIGTINKAAGGFLNDETGSRRFNIVELEKLDWNYQKEVDINQVWAQAVHLFRQGETNQLTESEVTMRESINEDHKVENPLTGFILRHYDIEPDQAGNSEYWMPRDAVYTHARRSNLFKDGDKALQMSISAAMKELGAIASRETMPETKKQARVYAGVKLKQTVKDEENDGPPEGYERHWMNK